MIGYAQIAQLVEQRTENPRVAGSIPALGITAEAVWGIHLTFNQVVRGSNPRCLIDSGKPLKLRVFRFFHFPGSRRFLETFLYVKELEFTAVP